MLHHEWKLCFEWEIRHWKPICSSHSFVRTRRKVMTTLWTMCFHYVFPFIPIAWNSIHCSINTTEKFQIYQLIIFIKKMYAISLYVIGVFVFFWFSFVLRRLSSLGPQLGCPFGNAWVRNWFVGLFHVVEWVGGDLWEANLCKMDLFMHCSIIFPLSLCESQWNAYVYRPKDVTCF